MDDLNKLNKNQIVLLTLLVSFVTSIATGIVTVTLIQQAPSSLTQPVERVVLKTVETVIREGKPETIIKEVPVIVTEEQLIIKVVNSASPAVVTVRGLATGTTTESVLSVGFLAAPDLIVASAQANFDPKKTYKVVLFDGEGVDAKLVSAPSSLAAILKLTKPIATTPLGLATENLAVGQTVVALGSTGVEADAIAVGIVSGVTKGDSTNPDKIRTSAANIDNIGSPLLGVGGKVVGISEGAGVALGQVAIKQAIDAIKK